MKDMQNTPPGWGGKNNNTPWNDPQQQAGSPISQQAPVSYQQQAPVSPVQPVASANQNSGSAGKIVLLLSLVILAVGGGIFGAVYFAKQRGEKPAASASVQELQQTEGTGSAQTALNSESAGGQPGNHLPSGITLAYNTVSLTVGDSLQYPPVKLTPEDAEDQALIWSSSDIKIAAVDASGMIVGVSEGSCTVTVSAHGNPAVSAAITVTVNPTGTASEDKPAGSNTQTTQPKQYTISYEGYVSADQSGGKISMYAEPTTRASVIQSIPDGTLLKLYESEELFWYYATYNGVSGYLSATVNKKTDALFDGDGYLSNIATTTGESVNLRSIPSKDGKVLTKIPNGTEVYTGTIIGEWRGVTYWANNQKYQGFVASRFVLDDWVNSSLTGVISTTTGESVNLRSEPSTSSKVLTKIPNGATVSADSWQLYSGNWYRVTYNGQTGYIRQDLVRH